MVVYSIFIALFKTYKTHFCEIFWLSIFFFFYIIIFFLSMPYILGHFIQQKQSIILKRGQRIFGVTIFHAKYVDQGVIIFINRKGRFIQVPA